MSECICSIKATQTNAQKHISTNSVFFITHYKNQERTSHDSPTTNSWRQYLQDKCTSYYQPYQLRGHYTKQCYIDNRSNFCANSKTNQTLFRHSENKKICFGAQTAICYCCRTRRALQQPPRVCPLGPGFSSSMVKYRTPRGWLATEYTKLFRQQKLLPSGRQYKNEVVTVCDRVAKGGKVDQAVSTRLHVQAVILEGVHRRRITPSTNLRGVTGARHGALWSAVRNAARTERGTLNFGYCRSGATIHTRKVHRRNQSIE